ncbi:2-oxo acid dehydrogenase subunit E2 [Bacillaceae bacterium Marseille-Q3522]|nr:2-oxo acid dehydrogenase subunit E2 [Bacillaceae bacterium Marseille-Q3522]
MAIKQITMPQLGESVTEGTLSKWLITVGDQIKKYDPLAEVMTDKVNAEIPSSFSGTIKELTAREGDTLSVGECICFIETDEVTGLSEDHPASTSNLSSESQENSPVKKPRFSPAVLKLSQQYEIDLAKVKGTGADGRITRKDVTAFLETKDVPKKEEAETRIETTDIPSQPAASFSVQNGDLEIPLSGVRRAIAANMAKSKHEIPHAWMMAEIDATNLVSYRNEIKDAFKKKEGFNLTYFAFFVKAAAQALKEYPQLNSQWAGDKIIQKQAINISIAVATEDALFVPVIKHADEKTIKAIAREISELAKKARGGKLTAEDSKDGTFTVNNTGSFGSVQSMGIINYPQAAILQIESIVKRPVVINGMIAIRDIVNVCISIDHRILDGLICGRFIRRLKEIIEHISKETTDIY